MAKGNKKGFLRVEEQQKIARYKGSHPLLTFKKIADHFNVSERQAYSAIHKYAELSKLKKRDYSNVELLKKIAVYKAEHPAATLAQLEKKFKVPDHVARYALQKYAEFSVEAKLLNATKKGRALHSDFMADNIDQVAVLKKQLNFILAELENNQKLVLSARIDMLYKAMRIRVHIQQVELESHLKRADADVIASIIKRFLPDATDDQVIKIYTEEYHKWQLKKGQASVNG